MRVALTSFVWLEHPDYRAKAARWVRYHRAVLPFVTRIVLYDNGSSLEATEKFMTMIGNDVPITIHRFSETLPRNGQHDYPYVWRYLQALTMIMGSYDKIVHMTDDAFVLNSRLASWVEQVKRGHFALWCPTYGFPDDNLQVICSEAYGLYKEWIGSDWRVMYDKHNGEPVEILIPFTNVEHGFVADRFGDRDIPQDPSMDLYSGCPLNIEPKYAMGGK